MARGCCIALLAAALSTLFASAGIADALRDGTDAFSKKDYAKAMTLLAPLAEQGDGRAECMVEVMQDLAKGTPDYTVEGVSWDCAAAAYGKPWSLLEVGDRFRDGFIHRRNPKMAVQLYRLAVDQGLPAAQSRLAEMYFRGSGVEGDPAMACQLWGRVAAQDHDERFRADAMRNYGLCYLNGTGVGQDMVQALTWWGIAAEHGDQDAKKLWETYVLRVPLNQVVQAQEILKTWPPQ